MGPTVAIAAGEEHVCAVQSDSTLRCWGTNYNGQTDVPVDLSAAVEIELFYKHKS
ncbi:MAG: RCC1 domain-containing protein [Cystobacterineae bacterium]|nr:RCC1 domain-containing protein [Cystobacterineae bacterium]